MTVKQLKKILANYENKFMVTIENNRIKVIGMYPSGDFFEEYINSAGGVWEGGVGYAPNGNWCGECSTFDCDKCDWKERENV